jgi:hypothetical protein
MVEMAPSSTHNSEELKCRSAPFGKEMSCSIGSEWFGGFWARSDPHQIPLAAVHLSLPYLLTKVKDPLIITFIIG